MASSIAPYRHAQFGANVNGNGGNGSPFSASLSGPFSPPVFDRHFTETPVSSQPNPTEQMDNIVNRRGGVNSSLYQSCIALRRRLAEVPGFQDHLREMDEEERESGDATDPVTSVWNMLRRGYPLMTIYNALEPRTKLEVDQTRFTESKLGKAATFKFLQGCLGELRFPANECFLIVDLYGQDTTGFVKVLKVINRVLDVLEHRGMLMSTEHDPSNEIDADTQPRSYLQKVIDELVTSERDYVQHLETLQLFKNQVEQSGALPGDIVHDIFMNLNSLLDFQRRFLIRIEQQNSLALALQNWGQLFVQYQEGFSVYEPFIANQHRCNEIVTREWDKIKSAPLSPAFQGMVQTQSVLGGFLMKPFQRLTKYPMLLKEMSKKGDLGEDKIRELEAGCEATSSILAKANAAIERAIDKESRLVAVDDLMGSVDDWKGHKIENFGELVLFGGHTVLKGDGQKDVEREYKIYLFERILLCCKEMNQNKTKTRLGTKNTDKKSKGRLQLKGRIFLQNVTDIMSFPKQGAHFLQIFWKGDPGVENFVIRFASEETRNKWRSMVKRQKDTLNSSVRPGTSETEFTYMKTQASLPNPYQEDDGDEDDERTLVSNSYNHENSMSRNASSTSLRSRSTTGAGGSMSRVPPPRFPLPEIMPLKLATSFHGGSQTPDERGFNSYFSPTVESPLSVRTSSQPGMFPFPRQPPPNSNGWPADGNKHNTAPPMGRNQMRDDEANVYSANGRNIQRPLLPPSTASQSAMQIRLRSASSPDIQVGNSQGQKRYVNGQGQPLVQDVPVPPIPAHMMKAPVSRSQNNSPTENQRAIRQEAQPSPNLSRNGGPQTYSTQYGYENSYQPRSDPRYNGSGSSHSGHSTNGTMSSMNGRIMSPNIPSVIPPAEQAPYVSQLKVKIWFEPRPSHVTIVVPIIIKHRSLIDRIDSKMEKVTASSIAKGSARLRYLDSEDELITIKNDEDVQLAIEEWVGLNEDDLRAGVIPDFELYWHEIPNHSGT